MSLVLDKSILAGTVGSALGIIAGVSLKNSVKHLEDQGQPVVEWLKTSSTPVGMVLFVLGWIGIGITTNLALRSSPNKLLPVPDFVLTLLLVLAIVGIVGAVMNQNLAETPNDLLMKVGFVGGWILLGLVAGQNSWSNLALTLPAALLVLASMTTILPLQRGEERLGTNWTVPKAKIVDGPGYPLFTIAWGLLALSNAMA